MVWTYVAGGLVAAALLHESQTDHNSAVEATYENLSAAAPVDGTVYADHIDGGPNPEGNVAGLSKVPDVVLKAGSVNSLIVEVETQESLTEAPADALAQLQDFGKRGYKRVLVVPDDQDAIEAAVEFVESAEDRGKLSGKTYIGTPSAITELV